MMSTQTINNTATLSTQELAVKFNELAQQEKWFEIQDAFFADNVKSIDPVNSPYFNYAEGKAAVRKKGGDFVKKIQSFHSGYTTQPVVGGNYFSVGRGMDITVEDIGRIQIDEVMLYEVKEGKIISEQFFY